MSNACRLFLVTIMVFSTPVLADAGPLSAYDPPLDAKFAQLLRKADTEAGAALFERKCSQCHDIKKDGDNQKGPHLWNVLGRKAATREGFVFSPAMKKVGKTWTYARLDYYLKDTEKAVPGREMNFTGIASDKQRADVIAYLRGLHDDPPPLP